MVIASAKIAEQLNTISSEMSGILILSAIITCVCTDYFQENVSIPDEANRKIDIALIGKNQLTIPIVQNLSPHLYNVTLYYRKDLGDKRNLSDHITVVEIANYEEQLLERLGLFNQDIVVCSANDDKS